MYIAPDVYSAVYPSEVFDMSCWVSYWYVMKVDGAQSANKMNLKNSTAMSLPRNRDPVSEYNPHILL